MQHGPLPWLEEQGWRAGRTITGVKCCQENPHQLHITKGSSCGGVRAKCFHFNAALTSLEEQTEVRIRAKTAAKHNHGLSSSPTNIHVADADDLGNTDNIKGRPK